MSRDSLEEVGMERDAMCQEPEGRDLGRQLVQLRRREVDQPVGLGLTLHQRRRRKDVREIATDTLGWSREGAFSRAHSIGNQVAAFFFIRKKMNGLSLAPFWILVKASGLVFVCVVVLVEQNKI